MKILEQEPGTVLAKIALATLRRVESEKQSIPEASLKSRIKTMPPALDFKGALSGKGPNIIAEVKLRSPSNPSLGVRHDPVDVAMSYEKSGARSISVLTEPEFFGGSVSYLERIRPKVRLPLLMKDFFVEPFQFLRARAAGADAVLLIAALLGSGLREALDRTEDLGLAALVEAHSEEEMEWALESGADVIGINSRNLKTLEIDLSIVGRLASLARGSDALLVAESGVRSRAEIEELSKCGCRAFLIGTSFMKTDDPGSALSRLLKSAPDDKS